MPGDGVRWVAMDAVIATIAVGAKQVPTSTISRWGCLHLLRPYIDAIDAIDAVVAIGVIGVIVAKQWVTVRHRAARSRRSAADALQGREIMVW